MSHANNNKQTACTILAYIIRTIRFTRSRYHTYLYVAPLKVIVFGLMGFLLHGQNFVEYFKLFVKAWQTHSIRLTVCRAWFIRYMAAI